MTSTFSATLRRLGAVAAAGLGLALTPIAVHAQGQPQKAAAEKVSYDDAMSCSGLFALLAGSSEGEPEEEDLIELSARWLMVASARKDSGVLPTETELQAVTEALIGVLDELESDAEREAVLFEAIDGCEARYNLIPEEFED